MKGPQVGVSSYVSMFYSHVPLPKNLLLLCFRSFALMFHLLIINKLRSLSQKQKSTKKAADSVEKELAAFKTTGKAFTP